MTNGADEGGDGVAQVMDNHTGDVCFLLGQLVLFGDITEEHEPTDGLPVAGKDGGFLTDKGLVASLEAVLLEIGRLWALNGAE